ncbi:MAG TPA: SBBP repeat-containing protein, partial [Roseiflexaceae bacterium]|nr:SBBP repeat-containing protein [Roseiflexaceae bacterium]
MFKPFHKRAARLLACVMAGALLGACAPGQANVPPVRPETRQPAASMPVVQHAAATHDERPDFRTALDTTPLAFVPNRGQFDARVAFASANRNTALFFTSTGVTWALGGAAPDAPKGSTQRPAITQRFVGANPHVVPTGDDVAPTNVNFFKGAPKDWHADLPTYTRVVYADLWPGIDLVYQGSDHALKYTLMVKPGADLRQIALAYEGASALQVTADGQLAVSTTAGVFHDQQPMAFQDVNGQHVGVAVQYALASDASTYSFHVSDYDRSKPLLIDPAVPLYSGYIGGAGDDAATAIALDSSGNAYITGYTYSLESSFPVASGADMTFNGSVDAFVAKISADGSRLLYVTYLGGAGFDMANSIAVDSLGNAYVAGQTQSDQTTFPVRIGPRLLFGGGVDSFVAKISADGTQLQYAGYIGGAGFDSASGIAVDANGSAYVAGQTQSDQTTFPIAAGPNLTFNGGVDGFVAKISADGAQLQYAGYIGGAGSDAAAAVTVDANGVAYLTGSTNSSSSSFPVKNSFDTSYNGGVDAFV